MSQYTIQNTGITSADIKQVVRIHQQEINQGFLSSLGDQALQPIFSLAVESSSGMLFVAKDAEQQVCGFLLGTININKFYKEFLWKKSTKAFFSLLPKLLSLDKMRKVTETLLYSSKKEVHSLPEAELLDIAILKAYQGSGLAQQLFRELSNKLREIGIDEFKITTGESLTRAQRFYEGLGAEKVTSLEVHKGQKTIVYVYKIPTINEGSS